jgi:hypothetical protein
MRQRATRITAYRDVWERLRLIGGTALYVVAFGCARTLA